MGRTKVRIWRVAWSAKQYTLSGVYFFSADTGEAALDACKKLVSKLHDGIAITIESVKEDTEHGSLYER